MLLVTVGLALMFTVGGLLGLSAIDEATQQVFDERLATAQATVAVFQRDVDRLASDVALVAECRRLLDEFATTYFSPEDLKHLEEHK